MVMWQRKWAGATNWARLLQASSVRWLVGFVYMESQSCSIGSSAALESKVKNKCEWRVSANILHVCVFVWVCVCFLYLLLERTPTESEAKALTASVSSQSLVWAARWDRPTDPLLAFTLCQYWPVTSTNHHRSHHSDTALVLMVHTNSYELKRTVVKCHSLKYLQERQNALWER